MRQTFDSSEFGSPREQKVAFSDPATPRGLSPRAPISGSITPPASKSLAQRALLFAGLANGTTRITGAARLGACDDITAAVGILENLGLALKWTGPRALNVMGSSPCHVGGLNPTGPFEVGESATLARLVTAIAGLCCNGNVSVRGLGTLERRRSPALFKALEDAGVKLKYREHGAWPLGLDSIGPPPDLFLHNPSSSQELSALLFAAACFMDPIQVHLDGVLPSQPYLELTRTMLKTFGVLAVPVDARFEGGQSFEVQGVLTAPDQPIHLEPDASSAAVALCAAAITGGELEVPGPWSKSTQGDREIVNFLAQFGLNAGLIAADEDSTEADLLATSGRITKGAELNLSGQPDLAPPLAAVAAYAALKLGEPSELLGLETLIGKECNRLQTLADGLECLGLQVEMRNDERVCGLRISAPENREETSPRALLLDSQGDHRMAFAFALFGLIQPGVLVVDPMATSKSWPSFWEDVAAL
ncbi:MAG: 3-phosphoshikimate 1-carboxyvinyltransferase [Bacteroidia bacterium]|jgi:3-phosphoshikimate 1-carboxyvinyltransferase